MRSLKSIIELVIVALIMAGCGTVKHYECDHFISEYYSLDGFRFTDTIEYQGGLRIHAYSNGASYSFLDKGDDAKYYESLCVKYNDYIKTDVYVIDGVQIDGPSYCDVNPVSINVVALTDFDETHKAGDSLNDIARLISVSPYKYITGRRKYDYSKDDSLSRSFRAVYGMFYESTSEGSSDPSCYYPVDKLLSDITSEDLVLLGFFSFYPGFDIKFETEPEGPCEVRIDIKTEDDRSFSLTATI